MSQHDEEKRRVLASSEELRGKHKTPPKRKALISVIALVVVLGLAIGSYYLVQALKPVEETPEYVSTTVRVVDRKSDEVAGFTVEQKDGISFGISIARDAEGKVTAYTVDGNEAYPLSQDKASSMATYCYSMTATSLVSENAENLADFGLTRARLRVTMRYLDGTKDVWLFGDKVPTANNYYMAREGSKAVYLIYASPVDAYSATLVSMHTVPTISPIASADIQDITVEQKNKQTVRLAYRGENEDNVSIISLRILEPFVYDANTERASTLMDGVAALAITAYAGEAADLPNCGLAEGETPVARILAKGKEDASFEFVVGNKCDETSTYVRVDDTEAVYLADTSLLAFLSVCTPEQLVDQFTNLVNITKVDSLVVTTKDDKFVSTITREPKLDENGVQEKNAGGVLQTIDTYTVDGLVMEGDLFKKLYQEIIGTLFSKISDDYNWQGEVYATVEYILNTGAENFKVEYLVYDDDYLAVRRDGQTLFLIKKGRVDNMIQKLTLARNGEFTAE